MFVFIYLFLFFFNCKNFRKKWKKNNIKLEFNRHKIAMNKPEINKSSIKKKHLINIFNKIVNYINKRDKKRPKYA